MRRLALICCLFCLVGCTRTVVITEKEQTQKEEDSIVCIGNDIYYFPYSSYTNDNGWESCTFAKVLSRYIDRHPDLEVVSVCANGTGMHGRDIGYYVVMRPKATLDKPPVCGKMKAESETPPK